MATRIHRGLATVGVIDNDGDFLTLMEGRIREMGYAVVTGRTDRELLEIVRRRSCDAVILDIGLPDVDGLGLLERVRSQNPDLPVIVEISAGSGQLGFQASARGAYDYIEKPVDMGRLEILLRRATDHYQIVRRYHDLETTITRHTRLDDIIGEHPSMQLMYSVIENVAKSDTAVSVMITGESGTGKELVARAIHRLSKRSSREMVDLNCAAIPENLLESELFGHEKGAFTGATQRYVGCCERANRSSLLLDEICDLNYTLQGKVLRFIQERNFFRVGGRDRIHVDIRIIAATNRNPLLEVRENRFREDLYFRLNVVPIQVPPLRERVEDIPLLAEHFLHAQSKAAGKEFSGISDATYEVLTAYPWPGNVRELENTIAQVTILYTGQTIEPEMLPPGIQQAIESGHELQREPERPQPEKTPRAIRPMWQIEREAIEHALLVTGGKVPEACQALEMSRATLYRKLKRYGIQPS